MNNKTNQINKEHILRQKHDRMRSLRVVKYLEYPFILPNSPVEIEEGYIVSDRDSYDIFASFIFKNIGDKPIKRLSVRIDCYLNQNIPYTHIDFEYSHDLLTFGIIRKNDKDLKYRDSNKKLVIKKSEMFGSCVYIPLPESYFTKLELILLSVEYESGELQEINTVVSGNTKKYNDLDDITKMVYARSNIYVSAEEKHPTKVIPQFGNAGWLCCCGYKNSNTSLECEKCGREKKWQQNNMSGDILEAAKNKVASDPREITLHDKSRFKQNKYLETKEETQKKIEQYEKAMKNIAFEEKYFETRRLMVIPKLLIAIGILYLLVFAIRMFIEFGPLSNASSNNGASGNTDNAEAAEAVKSSKTANDLYYI